MSAMFCCSVSCTSAPHVPQSSHCSFKALSGFVTCGVSLKRLVRSCSRQATPEQFLNSFKKSHCLFSSLIEPGKAQFVALLLLACVSARFPFGNHRSYSVGSGSSLAFCSLSTTGKDQPIKIKIKIRRTEVDMSSQELDLATWLEGLKEEAIQRGVSKDTVMQALEGVTPSEKVIERDQTQPEKTLTAEAYLQTFVSEYRIKKGVEAFLENRKLLEEVSADFAVPASILASIWGIESNYGSFPGSWNVIQALVTLAFNSAEAKRKEYFREEIFHALFILDKSEGPVSVDGLKGSWAGAMGQCQFMPSSYRTYAVDFDKDGRKDIWTSNADVFASIANYLVKHGWVTNGKMAAKVCVPTDIDPSLCSLDLKKPVSQWINEYNVVPCNGQLEGDELVSLVAPDGPSGLTYLVWDNFRVVMRYNISTLYSLSVFELAQEIDARAAQAESPSPATETHD